MSSSYKMKTSKKRSAAKKTAKDTVDFVYLVTWYGHGMTPISLNVVKDRACLQKHIDTTLAKIHASDHSAKVEGDSPDYFKAVDGSTRSGIYIRAKKVNHTLLDADILNPLGTL